MKFLCSLVAPGPIRCALLGRPVGVKFASGVPTPLLPILPCGLLVVEGVLEVGSVCGRGDCSLGEVGSHCDGLSVLDSEGVFNLGNSVSKFPKVNAPIFSDQDGGIRVYQIPR